MHRAVMSPGEVETIRKDMGLSRADFAALLGVAEATVWRWENRERKVPSTTALLIRRVFADSSSRSTSVVA